MTGPQTLVLALVLAGLPAHVPARADDSAWQGWETSRLSGSPEPPLPFTVERIYRNVPWNAPIHVIEEPGSGHLIVLQDQADPARPLLLRVANAAGADATHPLLTLPGWRVYGMAFDPAYATNRFVYLFLHGPTGHSPRGNRISRFVMADAPAPHIDLDSELRVIEWRSAGHDGGDLAFGNDGMLYITTGDGSSDSDAWVTGQTLEDLLGSVLRIDVRGATAEQPYRVPEDNPFVEEPGALPEIWAYGLRNPWRMSIDAISGQVWVGNNGQDLWETAHLVRRGENYGWSVYEGSHPFYLNRKSGPTPHVQPTIEHHHSEFRSLTGGVVYRGEKWPELDGVYIYGDYATGRIWGARHDGERLVEHRELADTPLAPAAFRAVSGGDLLVVDHLGNALYRLTRSLQPEPGGDFPEKLSATGLFRALGSGPGQAEPEAGVIPYAVNAPAWNDGATAERWMAVPGKDRVGYAGDGPWAFPDGTALVQTLSLPQGDRGARRVETRILLRQQNEWTGYSYRWNDAGTDAVLMAKSGTDAEVAHAGGEGIQHWHFPSRTECAVCHNRAANYVLGISGAQLNRPLPAGDGPVNQLRALEQLGIFETPPGERLSDPMVDPFGSTEPVDARARAYLHVNCAICHVEAGGGNSMMDLRREASPERLNIFNARPQHATFGLSDAMIVAPGHPDRSVMLHRIGHRGANSGQMPPLATHRVDAAAVNLLRTWIAEMQPARPIVRQWRMEDFRIELQKPAVNRSFLSGKEAFETTGCVQCHRFGGNGGSVGPDLTGIGKRLDRNQLLEAMLDPSATIAEGFAVPGIQPPLSTMPAGIVDVLSKEQLLDLLYYLERDARPRVAGIVTEYRHNAHADVILSRLLQTDTLDGKGADSPLELVSLYTDQLPANDTSRSLALSHGFAIYPTITEALTLGTGALAVDGVFLIAEHGDYPMSETGNRQYPKRRFWDEILAVLKAQGRMVPVFIDKHLSDNWLDAKHIHDSAVESGIPLMAGSSLPTTWRRPAADVDHEAELKEIVAITYHTTDAYGFHALEMVQALAEQRRGGESGIVAVRSTAGDAVWEAFDRREFDTELFDAAWARLTTRRDEDHVAREAVREPRLFSIDYADGLRAHLLELNGAAAEWSVAWRYRDAGRPVESSLFWTQEGRPGMHFTWLLNGIEEMMLTGRPSWNSERTLLTSAALDALLLSLKENGRRIETPHLRIPYQPVWRWQEPPPPPPMRPWSEP